MSESGKEAGLEIMNVDDSPFSVHTLLPYMCFRMGVLLGVEYGTEATGVWGKET